MSDEPRPPRVEDAGAVAALMSRQWPDPMDEQFVVRAWTALGVDLRRDARLEAEAYALVERLDAERAWLDIHGLPSATLLDWAEARARERAGLLVAGVWSHDEELRARLEARGYRPVRTELRMAVELARPTPAPSWPEDVTVRTFRTGDERTLYELQQETFRDTSDPFEETYEQWAHWCLQPPAFVPDLWFLACHGDEPVGFAVCHPRPATPEVGWVRVLGVRKPWRRRGIGRALLLHAFAELRRRGFARAGLGTDADSPTGAPRLYEEAGMHVTARFEIYEKELR
jgi:ribosomal protein S18 acetylase RimI-like enzyme